MMQINKEVKLKKLLLCLIWILSKQMYSIFLNVHLDGIVIVLLEQTQISIYHKSIIVVLSSFDNDDHNDGTV